MKFYEDPLYIKMCKEAKEIQKEWKPEFGDFISIGGRIESICILGYKHKAQYSDRKKDYSWFRVSCRGVGISWPYFTYPPQTDHDEEFLEYIVWLPRQDQLQEIWRQEYLKNPTESGWFGEFTKWLDSKYDDEGRNPDELFDTMEQLWLVFIMCLRFKKKWNPETEKWEALDEC